MVTTLYAGILGLLYIGLSLFVIRGRFKYRVGVGDGGDDALFKRIRLHGNFIEYVPFALILMVLAEREGAPEQWMHGLGLALVVGRLLHIYGFSRTDGTSFGRFVGTVITFFVIIVASVLCIRSYFVF